MDDLDKWMECRNRISIGLGLEGEQTRWIFNKAKEAIHLTDNNKENKEEIEFILHTLDVAIDELSYALATGKYQSNSQLYVNNAVRFIQEAKESIHKLKI